MVAEMFDVAAFGREIVATVKAYLERALEPIGKRLTALEEEVVPKLIRGAVFDLVDARNVKEIVAAELMAFPGSEKALEAISGEMAVLVDEKVKHAVDAIERPQNGIDGKDGRPGIDGAAGADGKDGIDGVPGADGKDGRDGIDGAPGIDGKDGRDGADGAP